VNERVTGKLLLRATFFFERTCDVIGAERGYSEKC
jgi:hypothetical protein